MYVQILLVQELVQLIVLQKSVETPRCRKGKSRLETWEKVWDKNFVKMWEDKYGRVDGGGLLFLLITVSVLL